MEKMARDPHPRAKLILIRHPQTEANAAHLLQGTTDSPLTALGQQQVEALVAWISSREPLRAQRGQSSDEGSDAAQHAAEGSGSDGPADAQGDWTWQDVEAIAHSPLGRCAYLAEKIAQALRAKWSALDEHSRPSTGLAKKGEAPPDHGHSEDANEYPPPPSALPASDTEAQPGSLPTAAPSTPLRPLLLPSSALREKSFGPLECTRRGVHAGPRFPRAPPDARRESQAAFRARVGAVGSFWMARALRCSGSGSGPEESAAGGALDAGERKEPADEAGVEAPDARQEESTPAPHRPPVTLLVTHGLVISTFLKMHASLGSTPGPQQGASASAGAGSFAEGPTFPFASNTGMFVCDVFERRVGAGTGRPCVVVQRRYANWTPHLSASAALSSGIKRGGAQSESEGKSRGKQRRLDELGFFKR